MSIIVLGTVALDTVTTPFGKRVGMVGGSAVHFAMSARLFSKVHLVAAVGEDFPPRYAAMLEKKGCDITSLIRQEGRTFHWEGKYTGDLNTAVTLRTELGVLSTFSPQIIVSQKNIPYVFLANVDPDIQGRFLSQMRSPKLVALDSMNFWIHHKKKALLRMLKRVDIYVANDQEARLLSGENNILKAARRLQALGPSMVLVKKGEHGVLCYSKQFVCALPAYPVENVIDPTGAGDTFAGGFMGYLSRSKRINLSTVLKAIAYGTIAASFNVEVFGVGRTAVLSGAEVEKRLRAFKRAVLF
jgi:sugar/nucleoside kinase (ribokinase family)